MVMRMLNCLLGLALVMAAGGCAPDQPQNDAVKSVVTTVPVTYSLTHQAEAVGPKQVRFTIETNAPLPIEVAIGVSLSSQKPDDAYIGFDDRITLKEMRTEVVLDGQRAQMKLPHGEYDAEVDFYPNWGAKTNPAASVVPRLHSSTNVEIEGDGLSDKQANQRIERRNWVMSEVVWHTPWNQDVFTKKLGSFTKSQAELSHLHDAYYFPGADMTIIVNRLKNEVTVWRMGKASR
ncbi:MAG: hypothetical protein AB7E60_02715 [Sphingobium sp.]